MRISAIIAAGLWKFLRYNACFIAPRVPLLPFTIAASPPGYKGLKYSGIGIGRGSGGIACGAGALYPLHPRIVDGSGGGGWIMTRTRGFYLLDLTVGIFLLLAVGSLYAHLVFRANQAATCLAAVRSEVRLEQSVLLSMPGRTHGVHTRHWVLQMVGPRPSPSSGVPEGFHWESIRPVKEKAGPILFALVPNYRGGRK